jgi:hypothetical protein
MDSDMVLSHIVTHGLFYAAAFNGYLLLMMVTTNPRVWGYADYSDEIKAKIPPQTKEEKRKAIVWGIPMMIFAIGFPIYSTYLLKSKLDDELSFWIAFINLLTMVFLAYLVDLVILDWLIVSKITPKFVIISGTEEADYKDFSHHYRAQLRAAPLLVLLCLVIAGIAVLF